MPLRCLIEAATDEFKQKLTAYCEKMEMDRLTPALAEQMSQGLQQALSAAGVTALRTFLESYERPAETLEVGDTPCIGISNPAPSAFSPPLVRCCWTAPCIRATTAGRPTCRWIGSGAWKESLRRWRCANRCVVFLCAGHP